MSTGWGEIEEQMRELRSAAYFVEQRFAMLQHSRVVYEQFREGILFNSEQHALRFGHFFITALAQWHVSYTLIGLRALAERSSANLGVYGLLERLKKAAETGLVQEVDVESLSADQQQLVEENSLLYKYASQYIAHYDSSPDAVAVGLQEADQLLRHVDEVLARCWTLIFGPAVPRLTVDFDPYWLEQLFSFPWKPPTVFNERLASGQDARIVPVNRVRDYTRDAVFSLRPTDLELDTYGITRADLEMMREGTPRENE